MTDEVSTSLRNFPNTVSTQCLLSTLQKLVWFSEMFTELKKLNQIFIYLSHMKDTRAGRPCALVLRL